MSTSRAAENFFSAAKKIVNKNYVIGEIFRRRRTIKWLNFHINNPETQILLAAVTNPDDYPFGTKLYGKRADKKGFRDLKI